MGVREAISYELVRSLEKEIDCKIIDEITEGRVTGVHKQDPTATVSFDCDEATAQLIKDHENKDSGCCGNGCGSDCVA